MARFQLIIILAINCLDSVKGACEGDRSICPQKCRCENYGDVDCSNTNLVTIPELPEGTTTINMTQNVIQEITQNDFRDCNSLLSLDLSHNDIKYVEEFAFQDLEALECLFLQNNKLDPHEVNGSLPLGILDPLKNLKHLEIQNNVWMYTLSYRDDLIWNKTRLNILKMDSPYGNETLSAAFKSLKELSSFELFGGQKVIENDTLLPLQNLPLKRIAIVGGNLQDLDVLALAHFPSIQSLDLSGNNNLGLGKNLTRAWYGLKNSPHLQILRLRNVVKKFDYKPYVLSEEFFNFPPDIKIKELYLDVNGLILVNTTFHTKLPHLEKLSLSYNRFFDFVNRIFQDIYRCRNLTYLDLSHQSGYPPNTNLKESMNNVKVMSRKNHMLYVFVPPKIRELYLSATFPGSYKRINTVFIFSETKKVTVMDVSLNKVQYVENGVRVVPNHTLIGGLLNMSGCGLNFLGKKLFVPGLILDTFDGSNNNLGNFIANDIDGDWLATFNISGSKALLVSNNGIKSLPPMFFTKVKSLETVDLGRNALQSFNSTLKSLRDLKSLDLSRNLLPHLSIERCKELDEIQTSHQVSVNMEGNPLQCACFTLPFLTWLTETKVNITNLVKYTCTKEGAFLDFQNLTGIVQQLTIECTSRGWLITTAALCVVIIVVLGVSVVSFRHRWDIRYFCLRLRRQRKYQQLADEEEEEDRSLSYDAFVAYHQDNLDWIIHQLIPNVENCENPLTLCIHHRNWLPGVPIEENICESIEKSRKTLVVLSKDFIRSGWCEFEVQMARLRGFEQGRDIIVVVALEDIALKDMSATLINLRRTHTWLDCYEHENDMDQFWILLKRALRKPIIRMSDMSRSANE